jgi:hypothetical protein
MGRPFGAFMFAIAAHKVADAARGAARAPLPVPVLPDLPDRCLGPEETAVAGVEVPCKHQTRGHGTVAPRLVSGGAMADRGTP